MFHVKRYPIFMVSRETSTEFAAGIVSLSATFIHIDSARVEQFGFQIKLSQENYELIKIVRDCIGIKNPIRFFKEGSTTYALLNTRSRKLLLRKVIPFMDERLRGPKLLPYLQWKQALLKSV